MYEKEKRAFLLLCRLTYNSNEQEELISLLGENINWSELIKYSLYHKTFDLLWYNLSLLNVRHIPKYIKTIMQNAYYTNKIRNKLYFNELNSVISYLNQETNLVYTVKGAMLIPILYKDYGIRTLGDLDFLIKHEHCKVVEKKLFEYGYCYGTYDTNNKCIVPMDRMELIKWKTGATNMCPFLKINNNQSEIVPFFKLDFRHSMDINLDDSPINEIIEEAKTYGQIRPHHVLVHLACHLFHEATSDIAVFYYKDINLIKFCDIREYIIHYMNQNYLTLAIKFANKYNLVKMLYYTFYYLNLIYHDGYENDCMNMLNINNCDFLNEYVNSKHKTFKWQRSFFERIFSCHNLDEIESIDYRYMSY